jgi:MinD superfamily P-loop ATPase
VPFETPRTIQRLVAVLDQERCVSCGACVDLCADGAITIERFEVKLDPSRCSGCGSCVAVCASEALSLMPIASRGAAG